MKNVILFLVIALTLPAAFAAKKNAKVVELKVTEKGFEPEKIEVAPGTDVTLKITRTTDATCAKELKFSNRKEIQGLPLNKTVTVALGKLEKGEISFACGMKMLTGHIVAQ